MPELPEFAPQDTLTFEQQKNIITQQREYLASLLTIKADSVFKHRLGGDEWLN
jgi:hypothetical protein